MSDLTDVMNELDKLSKLVMALKDEHESDEPICTGGSRCGCDECFDERAGKMQPKKEYVFVPRPKNNASPMPHALQGHALQGKDDVHPQGREHDNGHDPIDTFLDKLLEKAVEDTRRAKLQIEQEKIMHEQSLDPTMPVYTTVDGRRHADMRHMALPQIRQWAQNLSYDAYMRHKDMCFILPNGIKSKDDVLRVMNPPKPKSSVMNMFKDMIGMKSG